MSNIFQTTSIVTSSTVALSLAAGTDLTVAPTVDIVSTATNGSGVSSTGGVTITDFGLIQGATAINVGSSTSGVSTIDIAPSGIVAAWDDGAAAIQTTGRFNVVNQGSVTAAGFGEAIVIAGTGGGTWINTGTISSPGAAAVVDDDGNGADIVNFDNYGTITSSGAAYTDGLSSGGTQHLVNHGTMSGQIGLGNDSGTVVQNFGTIDGDISVDTNANIAFGTNERITNAGVINGDVALGGGDGQVFDSAAGQVFGTITAGAGSATIVAGTNGGSVEGGTGNDNLRANQSQTAADQAAQFVLDGAGGVNALYGGGAFNTFEAGDAAGGHNQIHGGLSLMSGVAGYANNTLDFSETPSQSVYVDLLNGHNAYLYANANHTGALTFEDSVQNVPNVIGSAGGDVIRADNGTDVIQGGQGADVLYAGTGFDTFVYKGYQDSNTVNGYDTISGFQTGKDKLDLSAFNMDPSHLAITSSSKATTLYLEQTPGTFNSATDLAVSFTGANAIKASDVIF